MEKRARHINIPIFVQHMGCPNQCVFCDQHAISGTHSFDISKVRADIEAVLETAGDAQCEIAFFGGSFTGIERGLMISLLDTAQEYVDARRVSGIRMSTRPDYISREITDILHNYTVSQVELGIQSFSDKVLLANKRGHTAKESVEACRLLAREGFSFVGQMMTGLLAADTQSEQETARMICELGAEGTRIYPCIVFKNTPLAEMTKSGEYIPLTFEEAVERSASVLRIFIDNGVPCLKIGLHESENLHSEKTYLAGPNHPALGEAVRGRVYYDMILSKLKDTDCRGRILTVEVPRGAVSTVVGQHRMYKNAIAEKTSAKCVKILENKDKMEYNISIKII